MTKVEFDANYSPLVMKKPFATDGLITPIGQSQDDGAFNFLDGFGSAFSAPKSNNGKYVTRGQINAIGNLASRNDFYRRCGGLNTFDSAFAAAIGGYPKGAVLDFIKDNNIAKIESLVDNNTVDPASINGADDVNWKFINLYTHETVAKVGQIELASYSAKSPSGVIAPVSMVWFAGVAPVSGNLFCTFTGYDLQEVVDSADSYWVVVASNDAGNATLGIGGSGAPSGITTGTLTLQKGEKFQVVLKLEDPDWMEVNAKLFLSYSTT